MLFQPLQVIGGENGDSAPSISDRILQALYKILSRTEIPRLKNNRVTFLLQLPGDPFSPETICAAIADKKILEWGLFEHRLVLLRHASYGPGNGGGVVGRGG